MPTYEVTAPDGKTYQIDGPPNAPQRDIVNALLSKYPESATPFKPDTGLVSAFTSSARAGLGSAAEGAGEFAGLPGLAEFGKQQQAAAARSFAPVSDEDVAAADKRGLIAGATTRASRLLEPFAQGAGSILGRYGLPLAAGTVSAVLPEAAAAAPFLGGTLDAIGLGTVGRAVATGAVAVADAPLETGELKVAREKAGLPPNPTADLIGGIASAAWLAVSPGLLTAPIKGPMAALLGKSAVQQAEMLAPKVLAGELTAAEASAQVSGYLTNAIKGTIENAAVGSGMMVGSTAITRGALGQDLTSPEAMEKYGEAIKGAVGLSPMFGLAHGIGAKGEAVAKLKENEAERTAALSDINTQKAEQAQTLRERDLAQAELEKQKPEYAEKIMDQYRAAEQEKLDLINQKRTVESGSVTETADRLHNENINDQVKALQPNIEALAAEYNKYYKPPQAAEAVETPAATTQPTPGLVAPEPTEPRAMEPVDTTGLDKTSDYVTSLTNDLNLTAQQMDAIKGTNLLGMVGKLRLNQSDWADIGSLPTFARGKGGQGVSISDRVADGLFDRWLPFDLRSEIIEGNLDKQLEAEEYIKEAFRQHGLGKPFYDYETRMALAEHENQISDLEKEIDRENNLEAVNGEIQSIADELAAEEHGNREPSEFGAEPEGATSGAAEGEREAAPEKLTSPEEKQLSSTEPEAAPEVPLKPIDTSKLQAVLTKALLPALQRFGLKDIGLKLIENAGDYEGQYTQKLISIALDAAKPLQALRHEAIHALKDMGFFTEGQWALLEKQADKVWIDKYLKERNVDGKPIKEGEESRFDAYMKLYEGNMEAIREEAIADAFADFDANGAPKGIMSTLLEAMRKFFRGLRSALTGAGYETADDVFGKVERGELKAAKAAEAEEAKPSLRNDRSFGKFGLNEQTISTRKPTSAKPVENHITDKLNVGIGVVKEDPKLMAKHAQLVKDDPLMGSFKSDSEEATINHFIDALTDNLLYLWNATPKKIRDRSRNWYKGANRIANNLADGAGISERASSGVLAALSPQTPWDVNVSQAARVISIWKDHQNTITDQSMTDWFDTKINELKKKDIAPDVMIRTRDSIAGKSFKELEGTGLQPWWLRAYDETHYSREYHLVAPEGESAGLMKKKDGSPANMPWGNTGNIEKALSILNNDSMENISEQMGDAHKVRSFYNNIVYPDSPDEHVTIDTHAVAAARFEPLSGNAPEVAQAWGGQGSSSLHGQNGLYGEYAEAYRRAAKELGVLPREVQSVTWEKVRGLFPDTFKTEKAVNNVKSIWKQFKSGEITTDEARARITESSPNQDPNWSGVPTQSAEDAGATPNEIEPASGAVRGTGAAEGAKPSLRTAPDTPEFKRWFKNSKVVDENGKPLVVYHTGAFDANEIISGAELNRRTGKDKIFNSGNEGIYFTADPKYSALYGRDREGTTMYPVYLSLQKPFVVESKQELSRLAKLKNFILGKREVAKTRSEGINPAMDSMWVNPEYKAELIKQGYDGIINKVYNEIVVFEPTQIKSAIGNQGTYDPTNPDIRKSLRTAPDTPKFKQWFGDSKIVDADGKPKVMYHGTARDITAFKPKQAGAIFLTDDPEFADKFSSMSADWMASHAEEFLTPKQMKDAVQLAIKNVKSEYGKNKTSVSIIRSLQSDKPVGEAADRLVEAYKEMLPSGPNIIPAYVKAENPFDYANSAHVNKVVASLKDNVGDYPIMLGDGRMVRYKDIGPVIKVGNWNAIESEDVQQAIKDAGFDGFYMLEQGRKNLAVYDPAQIKSATGNEGTYDINNPDIRKSLRTNTQEFKRWFGDSKVVDENGEPLVVYHGTDKDLSVFKNDGEPIFLTPGAWRANVYADREDGNVMPLYARVANPATMKQYETARAANRGPNARKLAVQSLKKQGYDGVIDDITVIAFEPTQIKSAIGNTGAFDATNPDIRKSLRKVQSTIENMPNGANILDALNKRTTAREEKGYAERLIGGLGPEPFSYLRQKFIYQYNQLSVYGKRIAAQMGGIERLADISAEAAALESDRAAGYTASALGVGNRMGGIPKYENGFTIISNEGGSIKGAVEIFAPLAKYADPKIYQAYQFWAMAKRGERLTAEGREKFTPDELAYAKQLEKEFPEFVDIQKDWIKYNDGLVKYMVDTGVLSKEMGAEWTKHSDYIPFYRQLEGENTIGPKIMQNLTGVKPPKKLKGSEAPAADFLETITRNTQAAITSGLKNVAAQKALDEALFLGEAEKVENAPSAPNIVSVLRDGKVESYRCADPLFLDAVRSLNLPELPGLSFISKPADVLRSMVTKDPAFIIANMMKHSLYTYATSGADISPITGTLKNFTDVMRNKSPEYQNLLNAGVIGGYEFSRNIEASAEAVARDLRQKTGTQEGMEKNLKPITGIWQYLEHATEAHDAAVRISVYKDVLAKTGNEAEALFRANEVLNFNRKGNSALVRVITAGIPFLNAKVQGLDLMYRGLIQPSLGGDVTARQRQVQKTALIRAGTMVGLSVMYAALVTNNPDYEAQQQEVKDNNWIIPGLGVRIPIPFEIGTLFKTMPEHIYRYFYGKEDLKQLQDAGKKALGDALTFTPIPQIALPIVEAESNYSYFTGRPIVGTHMQGIDPKFQVEPNTSIIAKELGQITGKSPLLIDHIYQGYTGTMGMYFSDLMDAAFGMAGSTSKPTMRLEQTPVIKRFLIDNQATGQVSQFYELKDSVETAVKTINDLKSSGSPELMSYAQEHAKEYAARGSVEQIAKQIQALKKQALVIRAMDISADEKRDRLLENVKAQNATVASIGRIKEYLAQ